MFRSGHSTRTYTKLWEILLCAQSLSCLKLKYPSFFSARWVSRHAGRDVICFHLAPARNRIKRGVGKCGSVHDLSKGYVCSFRSKKHLWFEMHFEGL
jgi:hypothetical protein